jgi:formate C-acetyltransferase
MATILESVSAQGKMAWREFAPGGWQGHVDVREFIQLNYTPYEGDGTFVAGETRRTRDLWQAGIWFRRSWPRFART